jgi:predicted nucleic acid-binding protein
MERAMRAVFDTNCLIDYLNGRAEAKVEFDLYEEKIISVVTFMEVMVGAKSPEEREILHAFLQTFSMKELTRSVANLAITLRQQHRLKLPDAIVYATARDVGCNLVTRNTKDFPASWPDVRLPYLL